jgi:hypothetical protein
MKQVPEQKDQAQRKRIAWVRPNKDGSGRDAGAFAWRCNGGAGIGDGSKTGEAGVSVRSKFYCNTKALTAELRARHKQLTDKLMAKRKELTESAKGYEFQFSATDVTLSELAEWVAAEGKCCPFFDFHIGVEREGKLLCLRLTGGEELKAFIRAEFGLQE